MSITTNIITAAFGGSRQCKTRALYQWDYGQVLQFVGLELPTAYTVHFSNQPTGEAKTGIGDEDGVTIPDEYLTTGLPVYAWLYLHTGDSDGETRYTVEIPVKARSRPVDEPPTPQQQSVIDQLLSALESGVERAETAAEHAEEAVESADGSAQAAKTAQTGAETAQAAAAGSAIAAAQSATQAASSAVEASAGLIYEDVSGNLVSFPDGANGARIKALTIGIEPVQSGSGDPSPDNVRPITGVSAIAIHHAGASAEYTYESGGLNDDGEETTASSYHRSTYIDVHGARNVYMQYSAPSGAWTIRVCAYDKDGEFLSLMRKQTHSANATWNATLTIPDDAAYIRFSTKFSATMDICVFNDSAIQLTLPSEVYGGSVTLNPDGSADVSACPYYASYAGEALAGPWVSSMDVYSAGATPTTGAQVVDLGGEKTGTHIPAAYTPPILTLLGVNNIWADCGPIEALTYPADTKLYIDKIIAAQAALG